MKRRAFLLAASSAFVLPSAILAQPARTYRIGLLNKGSAVSLANPVGAALVRGFERLGYTVGRNLALEIRGADGQNELLARLVTELASKVDVIIAISYPAALVAKEQTKLPVVVYNAGDPVGGGLVRSLALHGSHLTGISDVSAELTPKRLQLLKEIAPGLRRIAVLWNADDVAMDQRFQAAEKSATAIPVSVQPLPVRAPGDFDRAFEAMDRDPPDALLFVADSLTLGSRKRVFDYAASHRLPAMYEGDFLVRDGGLISYGPDLDESLGRVASLVDRILKGTNPATLPFEQPTQFRLAVNLKTAKALGIEIPAALLARADEVIE